MCKMLSFMTVDHVANYKQSLHRLLSSELVLGDNHTNVNVASIYPKVMG